MLQSILLILTVPSLALAFTPSSRPCSQRSHAKKSLAATGENAQEECSICVIGGGVSGLAAAYTAGSALQPSGRIVLLESSPTLGGRVQSDRTPDGYTLDRGFAVFLEEYPNSKALLDFDALDLHRFDPGSLVKQPGREGLSRVADPLRQPRRLFDAIASPVGTFMDKIRLVPLLLYVVRTPIDQMFEETETDTLTCLKERWKFSDQFIDSFLAPFLEGIYLAPLNEQSSRMFHFVFKMFTIGSVSLPRGGIGAAADQLAEKARGVGVDVRTGSGVTKICAEENGGFTLELTGNQMLRASSIVLAADVVAAQRLVSTMEGLGYLGNESNAFDEPVERPVGCLYYGFEGEAPIDEPILVLNGIGKKERGTKSSPINNACFPSVVCSSYAPSGHNLCSVSILEPAMKEFDGRLEDLDTAVRLQLSKWFPSQADAILDPDKWELKAIYEIDGAQPAQFNCPFPASVYNGRDTGEFRGQKLPDGMFMAGDHMTTASLNGALASGIRAGRAAEEFSTSLGIGSQPQNN